MTILPCPLCSSVIHDGALSRAEPVIPAWLYANMTSGKEKRDHFTWMACSHASPMGPAVPTAEREATVEKWNAEARRLYELRTANWSAQAREKFGRLLGFIAPTPEPKCPKCGSDDYRLRKHAAPGVVAPDYTCSWRECADCGHKEDPS